MDLPTAKIIIDRIAALCDNNGDYLMLLLHNALESPQALYDILRRDFGTSGVEFKLQEKSDTQMRHENAVNAIKTFHDMYQPLDKITAIKFYRRMTGVGWKEAKDAVEAIEISFPRGVYPLPAPH